MADLEVLRLTTHLSRVLKGQVNTALERQIYNKFWGVFSQEMFKQMFASYRNRSRNWQDELAAWKSLKPATIKAKKRSSKRSKLKPSLHPTWINFDSGRLMISFKPGKVAGAGYVPGKDQLWELTPNRLTLGTKVDYASQVDERRPLFARPRVLVRWAKNAAKTAFKAIVPMLPKGETAKDQGQFSLKKIASQKGLF